LRRHLSLYACAVLLQLVPLLHARAQGDEESSREEPDYLALADAPAFLPRSYLYWGTPVGGEQQRAALIFALSYALHLPVYNNLRERALRGGRWAGAATLSFEGDLRMLNERSSPVRMPSYRPTISGQLFHMLHGPVPVLFGLRLAIFHYSNGQERCTYDEALLDDSKECLALIDVVRDARAQLNRKNGNFSMNGWTLELHGRVHQLSVKRVAIAQLSAGISVSGDLPLGSTNMVAGIRRLYGWGRLGAEVDARRRFGWAALGARAAAGYFPNSGPRIPRAQGLVEVSIGPYWLTGFGFFVRYFGGRDFYNAFFVDRIHQFSAGLSWDGERPLKFEGDEAPSVVH
jgi:hypothetical protein